MCRPKGVKSRNIHLWTEDEKDYLKEITKGSHYKEIVELMNNRFECNFTIRQIKGAIGRYKLNTGFTGRYPKGNIPFNKGTKGLTRANRTSFKKGQTPVNHRTVGSERINRDGYTEIKVSEPNKWSLKHKVIWEKYNGAMPKGYAIIFGDRNKSNFNINNLILVSRQQLLILNKKKLIQDDADLTRTGIIIADIDQQIAKRKGSERGSD